MALGNVSSRIVAAFAGLLLGALCCNANLNCSEIYNVEGYNFNLTALITKKVDIDPVEEDTPPSLTRYTHRINPCGPLPILDDEAEEDQCSKESSRACRIVTIVRKDKKPEQKLVSQVISIASNDDDNDDVKKAELKLGPAPAGSDSDERSLLVTLYGKPYMNKAQRLEITFNCLRNEEKDTYHVNYTGEVLHFEWNTSDVCGKKDEQAEASMGVFTKFLLYLSLFALVYVGFGAYYNYRVYGSTGWDLLPHRDFWRDIPYIVSDLVKTMYSSMRTGGRAGYSSV